VASGARNAGHKLGSRTSLGLRPGHSRWGPGFEITIHDYRGFSNSLVKPKWHQVCMSTRMLYRGVRLTSTNIARLTYGPLAQFHKVMTDTPAPNRLSKLLLEREAAMLLRRSCAHVKRLRLERKLGYMRRRPVTIDEKDLEIYVAWAKRRRVLRAVKLKTGREKRAKGQSKMFEYVPAGAVPKPFVLLTIAEAAIKFQRTPRQIRYLCLRGRVPYIPGRPPLIDETDLVEHFENKRLAALAKIPPMPGTFEFAALQERKAKDKMSRRLHKRAVKRRVARILSEMARTGRK